VHDPLIPRRGWRFGGAPSGFSAQAASASPIIVSADQCQPLLDVLVQLSTRPISSPANRVRASEELESSLRAASNMPIALVETRRVEFSCPSAQDILQRVRLFGWPSGFRGDQRNVERVRDPSRDIVLNANRSPVSLSNRSAASVDASINCVDTDLVAGSTDAPTLG